MSGAAARKRRNVSLTAAAETYERLVASGELKGDAFGAAMRAMRGDTGIPLPSEMPALVEAIVRSQVSGDWRRALREVTNGRSRHRFYAELRMLVSHVLGRLGYHPSDIALALNRDRSTILLNETAFVNRMDEVTAARVERVLAATAGKEQAA